MITIYHGDCRRVLPSLDAESVDCVVTDPPYGETSLPWDRRVNGWQPLLLKLLKPSGSMWVFGSLRYFLDSRDQFSDWKISHEIIWEKHNGTGLFNDRFRRVHELAVHFYPRKSKWCDIFKCPQYTMDATARTVRKKARPAYWLGATKETNYVSYDGGPRLMRSVQYVRSEHHRAMHPTQKPEGILEPLIRYACPPHGVVLDPFAGSGATGIVAHRLGLSAILIEKDASFVDLCRQRTTASDSGNFSFDMLA